MCKEPWFTGDSNAGSRLAAPASDGSITFTLNRGEFTGDKSLVVQTSGPKEGIQNGTEIMVAIATGEVGDCEPVDAGHDGERVEVGTNGELPDGTLPEGHVRPGR